jgi:hypothetical protein
MGLPFYGVESMVLLGFSADQVPGRSALRKVGTIIRAIEEGRVSPA